MKRIYSRMRVKGIIAVLSACTEAGKTCPSHMQSAPQGTLQMLGIFKIICHQEYYRVYCWLTCTEIRLPVH
jgi:hypothetical protein